MPVSQAWWVTQGSYVFVPDMSPANMDTTKAYSLECLVRGDCLAPDYRFADLITSEAFFSHKYETGGISLGTCTGSGGSYSETNPGVTSLFMPSRWYHIVISVTSGVTVRFYVNGYHVNDNPLANRYSATVHTLSIGKQVTAPNGQGVNTFYNGAFALVRVWQKDMLQADVNTLLADLENAPRAGLLLEYLFGRQNPLSTVVVDSGPYGINGAITSADGLAPLYTGVPL